MGSISEDNEAGSALGMFVSDFSELLRYWTPRAAHNCILNRSRQLVYSWYTDIIVYSDQEGRNNVNQSEIRFRTNEEQNEERHQGHVVGRRCAPQAFNDSLRRDPRLTKAAASQVAVEGIQRRLAAARGMALGARDCKALDGNSPHFIRHKTGARLQVPRFNENEIGFFTKAVGGRSLGNPQTERGLRQE